MGFIILLIFLAFVVGLIFIIIKLNDLKYRATQQILKNTGISSSDINAEFSNGFEKRHLHKFLDEHPNFTEESLKDILKQYSIQILNRHSINEFSQEVYEKMQKDSKIDKVQSMEFKRVNINSYADETLKAIVIYTDNRDEYNMFLNCSILGNNIRLNKYQISKGEVVGF